VVLDALLEKRITPPEAQSEEMRPKENLCLDAGYVGKAQTAILNGFIPHIRPRGEEKKLTQLPRSIKCKKNF